MDTAADLLKITRKQLRISEKMVLNFEPLLLSCYLTVIAAGIVLAKVSLDDPKNHPLASQFGVQGFPTIRIFKHMYDSPPGLGTVENFDTQPRTYEAVVEHMRALGLPPQRIDTPQALAELRSRHVRYSSTEVSVLVLGLFADAGGGHLAAFAEASFGRAAPVFAWTSRRELLADAGLVPADHEGDAVVVVTLFDDDPKVQLLLPGLGGPSWSLIFVSMVFDVRLAPE